MFSYHKIGLKLSKPMLSKLVITKPFTTQNSVKAEEIAMKLVNAGIAAGLSGAVLFTIYQAIRIKTIREVRGQERERRKQFEEMIATRRKNSDSNKISYDENEVYEDEDDIDEETTQTQAPGA